MLTSQGFTTLHMFWSDPCGYGPHGGHVSVKFPTGEEARRALRDLPREVLNGRQIQIDWVDGTPLEIRNSSFVASQPV
jgi:hypothetical protein